MFIDNKYTRTYQQIVERAKKKEYCGYTEKHHVIPKSIGGTDNIDNLIELSAREHFICHLLLTKMVIGKKRKSMVYALWRMANSHSKDKYAVTSRRYELTRQCFIEELKGHPNYLMEHTRETKEKIKQTQRTRFENMSESEKSSWTKNSWSSPESWTDERKQKISESTTGKPKTKTEKLVRAKEKTRKARTSRLLEAAAANKGRTWTVVDGKRVWMEKTND